MRRSRAGYTGWTTYGGDLAAPDFHYPPAVTRHLLFKRRSSDGVEHFHGAHSHALVEAADGVQGKVRCGAVGVERSLITVLLVDDDGVRIGLDPVGNVVDAAGLLPGGGGELAKDRGDLFAVFSAEGHADGEGDHGGRSEKTEIRNQRTEV